MRYLELDVHLTRDGVVVVGHDYDLSRTCYVNGEKKLLGEFAYDELPKFRPTFTTGVMGEYTFSCHDGSHEQE